MANRSQRRSARLAASRKGVVALLSAADRIRRRFERLMEPAGITWQQYNVLRILRGAEPDGLPTMSIRDRLIEEAPGITRLIDRLERRGWVRRTGSPGDRRTKVCRITPRGLGLLSGLDSAIDRADESAFEPLSRRQLAELTEMLLRLQEART